MTGVQTCALPIYAQRVIGRETPFFAAPAPAARALELDRSKTRLHRALVPVRDARELGLAEGASGRHSIGFLLGGFLGQGAFQIARFVRDLFFDVAQRVIAGLKAPVQTGRQACFPVQDRMGERLETAVGRNRGNTAVVHALLLTLWAADTLLKN